jgi:hypothetical protein
LPQNSTPQNKSIFNKIVVKAQILQSAPLCRGNSTMQLQVKKCLKKKVKLLSSLTSVLHCWGSAHHQFRTSLPPHHFLSCQQNLQGNSKPVTQPHIPEDLKPQYDPFHDLQLKEKGT